MINPAVARRLVELACLAPSVHNTQPWSWHVAAGRIDLYADRTRQLVTEDPLGRNLVISCGAALDHLRVAAAAFGLEAQIDRLPDGPGGDLLAVVRFRPGAPSAGAAEDIAVLRARSTDRRRFTSWPIPPSTLESLAEVARGRGAEAVAVVDPGARFRLELLTQHAHLLRSLDPGALDEQASWVRDWGRDGIPSLVLPTDLAPVLSRYGPGLLSETRQLLESSDGVIAIGGSSDDEPCWLRTGEALSALWLEGTRDGLSIVPLSLPVELSPVRDAVRASVLDDALLPHILVRIGWQAIGRSELPRTPRRPVQEVLRELRPH